ncbi:DUF4760 domain-containing protein [Acinetobacter sp. 187]|uniref:DUF4760 domain-containing protein n=1 Tax=Acinetobacter lanii TaxID=2715163 RepID=UPI00140D8F66|nr:DUF4760 domain-containing protein [Acinetobacter lanii]NHC05027.1 DUF4760 domain-containing protein [Acinetobacter lanii]
MATTLKSRKKSAFFQVVKYFLYGIITLVILYVLIEISFKSATFLKMGVWNTAEWIGFSQLIIYVIAALIAAITIYTNIKTSRERATLDVILNDHNDHSFQRSKRMVFEFARKIEKDPRYSTVLIELFLPSPSESTNANTILQVFKKRENEELKEKEKEISELKDAFLLVMNRHEFYATGINSGLLDETIFKRTNCNTFVKLWDAFSSTVIAIRKSEGKETIFKDLEILAVKWKIDPLLEEDLIRK